MADNLKKNIGTPGSEENPSYYSKYNIRQRLFSQLISTSSEELFDLFSILQKLESHSEFEPATFGRVVKTAFYGSGGTFCNKKNIF